MVRGGKGREVEGKGKMCKVVSVLRADIVPNSANRWCSEVLAKGEG